MYVHYEGVVFHMCVVYTHECGVCTYVVYLYGCGVCSVSRVHIWVWCVQCIYMGVGYAVCMVCIYIHIYMDVCGIYDVCIFVWHGGRVACTSKWGVGGLQRFSASLACKSS